jgi:hypothetical protein
VAFSELDNKESAAMQKLFRQGDVLLVPAEFLPSNAVPELQGERIVLAYGEVTGHAHAIDPAFAVAYKVGDERFIKASPGATLVHEEHGPIELPEGVYKVVRQREYNPAEIRPVRD